MAGGMRGRGASKAGGVCMVGACVADGHAWQGVSMAGEGCVWQERRPLQRTVCILLECILVKIILFVLIFIVPEQV